MKRIGLFLAAFVGLLLGGCRSHEDFGGGPAIGNGFSLSYNVLTPASQTKSGVTAFPEETRVNSMHVLFFEYFSNGSGKFIESIYLKNDDGSPIGNLGSVLLEFPMNSSLDNHTDYSMLICANIDRYIGMTPEEISEFLRGRTENEAQILLALKVQGVADGDTQYEANNENAMPWNDLPMSGRVKKPADENIIQADLTRSVIRFDLENQDTDYILVSASIWNAFPNACLWENVYMDFSVPRIKRYYGVRGIEENVSEGKLYAFENYETTPNETDRNTTCLILGFQQGAETYYYRVNVNARSIGQYLKRNNVYRTTVKRVLEPGAASEMDAYKSNELLLEVDINGWLVDDNGNIQYDGKNMLVKPTSQINFSFEGGTQEYNIFTVGDEYELKMLDSNLPAGITANLDKSKLTVSALPSEVDKSGKLEFTFGPEMRIEILVEQNKLSIDRIDLDVLHLDPFPAEGTKVSDAISVKSSGEWTAKLYDPERHFSFNESGALISEIDGNDGTSFVVRSVWNNTAPPLYYAFVIVTLDSNPKVNRTIVLVQDGSGGIGIYPMPIGPIYFSPSGMTLDLDRKTQYVFQIVPPEGELPDSWMAYIKDNPENFEVEMDYDYNVLVIKSLGPNTGADPMESVVRVKLRDQENPFFDIHVIQQEHTLTLSSPPTGIVSAEGGTTTPVTVYTKTLGGLSWTATVTSTGGDRVTFNGGSEKQITGYNEDSFTLTFPRWNSPGIEPEATVTVTHAVSDQIIRTFTVKQAKMNPSALTLASVNTFCGLSLESGSDRVNHVGQITANLRDLAIVGPLGMIPMSPSGYLFKTVTTGTPVPDETVDIFQLNCASPSASEITSINNWLAAKNTRILIVSPETAASGSGTLLMGKGFTTDLANNTAREQTRVVRGDHTTSSIHRFLLKDGPAANGEIIDASQIAFKTYDGVNAALTAWPATFIPIVMDPRNDQKCLFGIDPTQRIIFLGDCEIFGNNEQPSATTGFNYVNPPYAANNMKFLNNFIAWMTYAAQYGDAFLDQFK